MNTILQKIARMGLTRPIYDTFFVLGFVSVFLFVLFFGKKQGVTLRKSVAIVLTVYPVAVLWMFVMFWIENGFRSFGGNNIVRVFVYVPLFAYPVAKVLKMQWKEICGMLAVGPVAVHAVSHLGCIFPGCCMGYPCAWGVYNAIKDDYRFPIQPIEALIAWAIIVFLLWRAKRKEYVPDGYEYPIMLLLFGSTRFVCEFFRDNEKILFGCSSLAFHALFMTVVGAIAIVIIRNKKKHVELHWHN